MAVLSLVLGIVGLVSLLTGCFFLFCIPLPLSLGVVAWVLGRNALISIESGEANPNERGIAQAGMILGIITAVLSLLGCCCSRGLGMLVGMPPSNGWVNLML